MIIKSSFQLGDNIDYLVEWHDADSFDEVPYERATQVYAVPFYRDKVLLVHTLGHGDNLPGGTIEPDETYEQTLRRELQEETNTRVIDWLPIGYQIVTEPDGKIKYQLRVVATVDKIGEFVKDAGGSVHHNLLVEPAKVNEYIKYGEVGDRVIARAIAIRPKLKT